MQLDAGKEVNSSWAMVVLITSLGKVVMAESLQFRAYKVEYLKDMWNCIDVITLFIVCFAVFNMLVGSRERRPEIIELTIIGTMLLWLRMLDYLSGTEVTSAYVRMTYEIIGDLKTFMVMLAIFVIGNAYVLQYLYPVRVVEPWDPTQQSADAEEFWKRIPSTEERLSIENKYGSFSKALFTSMQMMFLGEYEDALIKLSFRPNLAHYNYIYAVILVPVIMLNLLIALMGGSYERCACHTSTT